MKTIENFFSAVSLLLLGYTINILHARGLMLTDLGKWLIFIGLGILVVGIFCVLANKIGISFGRLPGDIHLQKEKISLHFPIATSILLSILLTLLLNFIFWLMRR